MKTLTTKWFSAALYGNIDTIKSLIASNDDLLTRQLQEDKSELQKNGNMLTLNEEDTALHIASQEGHTEIVKLLVGKIGEDQINAVNSLNETPLFLAAEKAHRNIVDLLLKNGANPSISQIDPPSHLNEQSIPNYYPLHKAAENGSSEIIELLAKQEGFDINIKCTDENLTALHLACEEGCEIATSILVNKGADVTAVDSNDRTAIHYLLEKFGYVNGEHQPFHSEHLCQRIIDILLKNNVNIINKTNKDAQAPLHIAIEHYDSQLAKHLLTYDALDVDLQDHNGNTALHLATRDYRADLVGQIIQKKKADIHIRNETGETALVLATQLEQGLVTGKIFELLLEAGAKLIEEQTTFKEAYERCEKLNIHEQLIKNSLVDGKLPEVIQQGLSTTNFNSDMRNATDSELKNLVPAASPNTDLGSPSSNQVGVETAEEVTEESFLG